MKFPGDTGMTPSDVAANTPLIENKEIQVQRANLVDIVDIMKGIKNIGTILLYHNIFGSSNFDINNIFVLGLFGFLYRIYAINKSHYLCPKNRKNSLNDVLSDQQKKYVPLYPMCSFLYKKQELISSCFKHPEFL